MSRFARLCAFAVLALARAVSGQIVLEPGDIIAGSTRPAVNGEGETYDAGKLIVFGRNGVLKGDFVELPTPPSEPLYWNGVIYVSTFDPRVIARVDSSGNLLSPFATNVSVAYLSPGPAQGLLGTNRSGELYQLDANGSVIRFRDSSTFPRAQAGIELAPDGCTVFYVVSGVLARWDACLDTPGEVITPPLSGALAAIRLLPDGTFLVASFGFQSILHVGPTGNVIRDYNIFGDDLALDIDGQSFWTSQFGSMTRVNITTGAILTSVPYGGGALGLTVVGEPRAGFIGAAVGSADIPTLSPFMLAVFAALVAAVAMVLLARTGSSN